MILVTWVFVVALICYSQLPVTANNEDISTLIESALYTRHEFFGAQAIVSYPTAEARNRLADVLAKYPGNPQVLLKLAQLDEKLGREEEAFRAQASKTFKGKIIVGRDLMRVAAD